MNCTQARELLPALIYGDLVAEIKTEVDAHLATCAHCREEQAALVEVRRLLEAAPVPEVRVIVSRILEQANQRQHRQACRWRRAAVAFFSAAAALLVMLVLRLEVRWEGHQLVLRWGPSPPADTTVAPKLAPAAERPRPEPAPEVTAADMKLVKDLVHALAAAVVQSDGKFQQNLALLELRLDQMQEQARTRWATTQSYVSALHAFQVDPRTKGEKQ